MNTPHQGLTRSHHAAVLAEGFERGLGIASLRHSAYSAQSERRFHAIVNARCVLAAADTNIGSGVHDDIGDGHIPAVPCSDSQATRRAARTPNQQWCWLEQQAAVLARGRSRLGRMLG
jgi:hypothetical protein